MHFRTNSNRETFIKACCELRRPNTKRHNKQPAVNCKDQMQTPQQTACCELRRLNTKRHSKRGQTRWAYLLLLNGPLGLLHVKCLGLFSRLCSSVSTEPRRDFSKRLDGVKPTVASYLTSSPWPSRLFSIHAQNAHSRPILQHSNSPRLTQQQKTEEVTLYTHHH